MNAFRDVRLALDRMKALAASIGSDATTDMDKIERAFGDLLRRIRLYAPIEKRVANQVHALANKKNRITKAERDRVIELNRTLSDSYPKKTPRYTAIAGQIGITTDRVRSIVEGRRPSKKK
jgi:hypothetical protein